MGTHDLNVEKGAHLILAHPRVDYATAVARSFRRLGWTVHLADDAETVRRLVGVYGADLVVMATELPFESGWLACDKLTHERAEVKVVLITDEVTPQQERFASFVGAARLLSIHSAPAALLELATQTVAV
jgi:DNA-binding response OmpR family regulator